MLTLPAGLATSAAATTAAAIAAESTAAAKPAFGLGPGFIDRQAAATHLELIEFGSRLLRLLVGGHLDERESPRASRRGVTHDTHRLHCARLAEELLQLRFSRAVRKIPDVKPSTHTLSSLCKKWRHHSAQQSRARRASQDGGSIGTRRGRSGRADHQGRVVYQRSPSQASTDGRTRHTHTGVWISL